MLGNTEEERLMGFRKKQINFPKHPYLNETRYFSKKENRIFVKKNDPNPTTTFWQ